MLSIPRKTIPVLFIFLSSFVICNLPLIAKGIYQEPIDFINETFNGNPPAIKKLWITKTMQPDIKRIMNRPLKSLRLKYWSNNKRVAFILEEIGKEKPITVGLVVGTNGIEKIKILIFRETRGWEVRYPFFTDQFPGVTLDKKNKLSQKVDNVSGATLSVNAVKKLARLALYLYPLCETN